MHQQRGVWQLSILFLLASLTTHPGLFHEYALLDLSLAATHTHTDAIPRVQEDCRLQGTEQQVQLADTMGAKVRAQMEFAGAEAREKALQVEAHLSSFLVWVVRLGNTTPKSTMFLIYSCSFWTCG